MAIRRTLTGRIAAIVLAVVVAASMSATLLPSAVYADSGQTKLQQDVQGFIDKTDESYAKYITKTLATEYPSTDKGMSYVKEGNYAYGYRNAGSDAEHAAADFLAGELEKLGLEVSKDPVTVDKWQYNGATFEMEGMEMEDGICSYASSGTDKDGVTGEIVYLGDVTGEMELAPGEEGSGYEGWYEDYYDEHGLTGADRNMKGKIVVADIHQYNDNWITPYYQEAYHQGAAALITYSYQYCNADGTQTGTKWDHAVQIQDLCASNYKLPTVAISRCDGLKIKEQIAAAYAEGKTPTAKLTVDNVVEPNGTSYNVVGILKGSANTGQRIVISGHYDKYWYGFNDDCAAIGNVFGVAKAMVDSGYKPINDIVFIAHGAEEWGQVGTETDWATGSWQEIYAAHPEWQGTTLGMINFELPAMTPDALVGGSEVAKKLEGGAIGELFGGTEQVSSVLDSFVDGDLLKQVNASTGKEVIEVTDRYYHAQPMSDAYGWQFCGVPCYEIRGYYGAGDDFSIYHTPYDDEAHYAPEAMDWCIKATAAFAAQIDQSPAVEFNADKISDKLIGTIDKVREGEEAARVSDIYAAAGIDTAAFKTLVEQLRAAGADYENAAKALNEAYTEAVATGASEDAQAYIKFGVELNKQGMQAFRICQDDILVVLGDGDAATRNDAIQTNYDLIETALGALKEFVQLDPETASEETMGEVVGGILGNLWQINGGIEYTTYCFSDWAAADAIATVNCSKIPAGSNRAWGHKVGYVDTHSATYAIFHTLNDGAEGLVSEGFKDEIATYEKAQKQLVSDVKTAMARETTAVKQMTKLYAGHDLVTPAKVVKVKAKAKKGKKVVVSWKKASGAATYQIAYKVKSAKSWKYKTSKSPKLTIKKLKKGKTYQVKVRALSEDSIYGAWSKTTKVKVKK